MATRRNNRVDNPEKVKERGNRIGSEKVDYNTKEER